MFLPSTLTRPRPRKAGVYRAWPAIRSTMKNQIAIAVAPMKPVSTPSRKKLCCRSAMFAPLRSRGCSFAEDTFPSGIFQAERARSALSRKPDPTVDVRSQNSQRNSPGGGTVVRRPRNRRWTKTEASREKTCAPARSPADQVHDYPERRSSPGGARRDYRTGEEWNLGRYGRLAVAWRHVVRAESRHFDAARLDDEGVHQRDRFRSLRSGLSVQHRCPA